jgi:hypothetical protein
MVGREFAGDRPSCRVPEFTIEIQSHAGADVADEAIDALHAALVADGRALGPAIYVSPTRGILGARYQVEAREANDAWSLGVEVFERALKATGQPTTQAGALSVEPEPPLA